MNQFLGVIPESNYAESKPIRKIVKEIISGRKVSYSKKELGRIVEQRYFSFKSMVSLTDKEADLLRKEMIGSLQRQINGRAILRKFLESDCYITPKRSGEQQNVYIKSALKDARSASNLRLMTGKEKLAFLEDPNNLDAWWHEDWFNSSFAAMGYRHFKDYPISARFSEITRQLQESSGKKDLRILDLGGGIGLALSDIKKEYPELITYNATRDEEFSHHTSDFHVVSFMERMPFALRESIDLIFSNMATRYFVYTDLVIQCCVAMLAKGGIMDVSFSSDRSDNPDRGDVKRRMKKAHDFLKDLENSGVIELEINNRHTSCVGGSFKSDEGSLYPAAKVFIRKL